MARNDARNNRTTKNSGDNPGDARRPHSIRFSDSEWALIEDAALRYGVSAGEIVRSGALTAAGERRESHIRQMRATW